MRILEHALLYEKQVGSTVKCLLCSHYCEIKPGNVGTCLLRKNINGELFTFSYGVSTGFAIDPIEKKPFYHFKPGSKILSFGTPGCNFKCLNCQNWELSHAKCNLIENLKEDFSPAMIADMAIKNKVDGIAYTYSEPTIFFEYARDTILECRKKYPQHDLFHLFISNGFMSKETIDIIESEKLISAINIDLKFMSNEKYRKICNATLQPVLDNIIRINSFSEFLHMEIINLVIPGENDTQEDFEKLSRFIYSVNPSIPVHFSRFHPSNRMNDKPATDLKKLLLAKQIAQDVGLKYVYIGNTNLPNVENTYCPNCNTLLIERNSYSTKVSNFLKETKPETENAPKKQNDYSIGTNGSCLKCEHNINIRL